MGDFFFLYFTTRMHWNWNKIALRWSAGWPGYIRATRIALRWSADKRRFDFESSRRSMEKHALLVRLGMIQSLLRILVRTRVGFESSRHLMAAHDTISPFQGFDHACTQYYKNATASRFNAVMFRYARGRVSVGLTSSQADAQWKNTRCWCALV